MQGVASNRLLARPANPCALPLCCMWLAKVCFRGSNVFGGYYRQEDKTREAFDDDGWLMSGDIGLWTTDGALKIIGGCWWCDRRDGVGDVGVGVDLSGDVDVGVSSGGGWRCWWCWCLCSW